MTRPVTLLSRRDLLSQYLAAAVVGAVIAARVSTSRAADAPLLSESDPAAATLRYTEDATKAQGVPAGNTCATCALYQGAYGSAQGPCQIFPGKQVKAAGWCSSWSPQM